MSGAGPGVVVVLSGGGAKASAHAGAYRALEEAGLTASHLVGTSMGAVVAALLATGLSADQVLERMASVEEKEIIRADRFSLVKGLWARSMLQPDLFRRALERIVPARRFEELKIPLTVTATALDTGELVLFGELGRSIPLLDALYASAALPLFFPPAEIGGRRYADGGLRAVLPLEAAAMLPARLVVAVDVGPGLDQPPSREGLPPVVATHNEALGILMGAQTAANLALWRANANRPPLVYIRPRVEAGGTFKVDQIRRNADLGYAAARPVLAGLKSGTACAD